MSFALKNKYYISLIVIRCTLTCYFASNKMPWYKKKRILIIASKNFNGKEVFMHCARTTLQEFCFPEVEKK